MARPPKKGLDFVGWETGVLDNDTKLDRLIEAQGIAAFTVYFYLCQHAYSTNGYYLDWGYSSCATTARKLGKGASAGFVKEVVDMCFQCSLFDKGLFDKYEILTSRGIQRRYLRAMKRRVSEMKQKKFWLLEEEESQGFDECTQNSDIPPGNESLCNENGSFCNGNCIERTEQNITQNIICSLSEENAETENETTFTPPTLEEVEAACAERESCIDPKLFFNYYQRAGWVYGKNKIPMTDWKTTIEIWEKRERNPKKKKELTEESSEYEEMVAGYIPTYRKKGESAR